VSTPSVSQYLVKTALRVNTSSEHEVVAMNRRAGEEQLVALARSSEVEEIWIYIEGTNAVGQKVTNWYEIGTEERKTRAEYENEILLDILLLFQDGFETQISVYHIHPQKSVSLASRAKVETPSPEDVNQAFDDARIISEVGFNVTFDHRIVTGTGIYKASLSKEVLQQPEEEFENYRDHVVSRTNTFRKFLSPTTAYVSGNDRDIAVQNQSFAKALSQEPLFWLSFETFVMP